ncbi:Scarecrow-like protein 15 [Citrus sinensis]|uniref:Uncharacterized protein n=2 Tax=Citrus TaxID=2706 RepID=V4SPC8_CITCL|nr:scarecrow-like protein 15 [Citrus x clementina]XP_006466756.1 scarecrow-like protein 15 [Citrus sinensis]ESR38961.1 hypothetical protein CICLE_v10025246mg [Citrus x clementina]KAH9663261.1 Scarecrow-like protein 15 [Citrus sinensis]
MRVPVKSPQNSQSQSPKRVSSNNNINSVNVIARNIGIRSRPNSSNKCYEPTSVLELRRSPSPVAENEKPATVASACATEISANISSDPSIEWEEHVLRTMDWESAMKDLGLDDYYSSVPSNPTTSDPDPHLQIRQNLTLTDSVHLLDQSYFNFNIPDICPSSSQHDQGFIVGNNFSAVDVSSNSLVINASSSATGTNIVNVGFEFDFIQELLRAADCFDSNELRLAQIILARLNQRLRSPAGKPLERAAFFFKEALNSLLNGLTRPTCLSLWPEIIQSVRAYKAFSGMSPIPMFTHFTTTQALLESLEGSPVPLIHIIDFDIGFGSQYASFMREIAEKAHQYHSGSKLMNLTSLRITAIVSEGYVNETRLIKDNLVHFAQELRIRFHVDFLLLRTFEMLSFKAVKFMDGEKTSVVLSPTIFRRLANSTNNAVAFVNDLRRISPTVVVFTDNEAWAECGSVPLFRRNFVNSLEYYTMVFESLDAAAMNARDWARKIETYLLRPKITAAVEVAGARVAPWREVFSGAGMRPVQLSQFADFLAECLLAKVQVGGFHVAKRQAELVLCWHQWALVATSAWRF